MSLIVLLDNEKKSNCGYCGRDSSAVTWCVFCKSLYVADYKCLIDRGWRRSGRVLYRYDEEQTCCPALTIRMEVDRFSLHRKSHKRALKNLSRHLNSVCGNSPTIQKEFKCVGLMESFDQIFAEIPPEIFTIKTEQVSSVEQEEYDLYTRYQTTVHHEDPVDISKEGFKRFIVESPLVTLTTTQALRDTNYDNEKQSLFGSFHQRYYLMEKLIAVGVVDVLPGCFSSVYFFYDPDFSFLELGKVSALYEIYFVKKFLRHSIPHYYMGYYIRECGKMSYKAQYEPSYLLNPSTLEWHPIEEISFDVRGSFGSSCRLVESNGKLNDSSDGVAADLKFLIDDMLFPFESIRKYLPNACIEHIKQFVQLIGHDLTKNFVILLH